MIPLWSAILLVLLQMNDEPAPQRGLTALVQVLRQSDDEAAQADILRGMYEALRGRRGLSAPLGWTEVRAHLGESRNAEVRDKVLALSIVFGDAEAVASARRTVADAKANADDRRQILQTLLESKTGDLLPLLRDLVADPALRGSALRGLAAFDDPKTPELILRGYTSYNDADKMDAIATLAARPAYALALLQAMERGQVPRRDLSPFVARQLAGSKDERLKQRLTEVWGAIRQTGRDKTALLARYKLLTPPDALKKADRSQGRAVFAKNCATCHTLFNEGAKIGPDLTGSQRTNPDYVLTKVLDPNAVVSRDYQVTIFRTTDGRVVNGLIKEETAKTITIQTQNEVLTLAVSDIEERKRSTSSMMPEGLLEKLSDAEVRDLIAYLAGAEQVRLPPGSQ